MRFFFRGKKIYEPPRFLTINQVRKKRTWKYNVAHTRYYLRAASITLRSLTLNVTPTTTTTPTTRAHADRKPQRLTARHQAIEELLEVEDKRKEKAYSRDTYCVGLARVGQETQRIVSGPMSELLDVDFGAPLHSLIISGTLFAATS